MAGDTFESCRPDRWNMVAICDGHGRFVSPVRTAAKRSAGAAAGLFRVASPDFQPGRVGCPSASSLIAQAPADLAPRCAAAWRISRFIDRSSGYLTDMTGARHTRDTDMGGPHKEERMLEIPSRSSLRTAFWVWILVIAAGLAVMIVLPLAGR